MKTYKVSEFAAYCAVFGTEKQYAVYEDAEGQRQSYMAALFADKGEAQAYADAKNRKVAQGG